MAAFIPVLRNRLFQAGFGLLILLSALALSAPWLTRAHLLPEPIAQDARGLDADGMPVGPNAAHWLGTDDQGRDVLSQVIYGARVSLSVGVAAMLTATLIGVSVGLFAGYFGGKLDLLLMRFTEMNLTIPAILLAVAFAGLMDGKVVHLHPASWNAHGLDLTLERGLVSLFLVIGLVCWPGVVRVIRAQVMSLKEREFMLASKALGASHSRILWRHIVPNILPTVVVLAAMTTANTILLEGGLGYLGIGVPPPTPSWGSLIAAGQSYFVMAPQIVIAPGVAIMITVLAFNLMGQGLQEVFDPKRRS